MLKNFVRFFEQPNVCLLDEPNFTSTNTVHREIEAIGKTNSLALAQYAFFPLLDVATLK